MSFTSKLFNKFFFGKMDLRASKKKRQICTKCEQILVTSILDWSQYSTVTDKLCATLRLRQLET